ncbi:MAG: V-type ATP synthase subunit I [Oscillospiraceae bacterium]
MLKTLYRFGCVELESGAGELLADYSDLLHVHEENTGAADAKARLTQAVAALNRYAPQKVSMLAPRRAVSETQFYDRARFDRALDTAQRIVALVGKIDEAAAAENRLASRIASLTPWEPLDVALDYEGGPLTVFATGVLPASTELAALSESLASEPFACALESVSADREQQYITLLVYRPDESAAIGWMKAHGLMLTSFKGLTGTALENTARCRSEIAALQQQSADCVEQIRAFSCERADIEASFDATTMEVGEDALLSAAGQTEKTVVLLGWVPEEATDAVGAALDAHGCAWQASDPVEGDDVPVTVKNNRFVDPFVGVTDMYGTPAYDSILDPNPLMSIFYFTFFGFIMADAMYGLLMIVGCYLYLRLKRPAGSMKRMLTMFMYCGVSTFIAGVLTGGWFGDAVYAISSRFGAGFTIPALWFEPLADPMMMLAFSLGLGALQILTGTALSAYRMIKRGHPLDALFDVGSWYVVFIGVALFALGIPAGKYVMLAGALMLLLTGGRNNKGLGKITGGLGSIYNVTGYISDLLSYSRIMALGLSGAVVGQVINKIATMGSGIFGLILFVAVFLFGHVFNLAIGLLGAYVHTSRLQYIEFFGRFFEDGGRPFRPLTIHTKYTEIIKED